MTRTSVYFSVSSVARNVSVKILVCGCVSYPPTGIYYLWFTRPFLAGRRARGGHARLTSEYDATWVLPQAIKGQRLWLLLIRIPWVVGHLLGVLLGLCYLLQVIETSIRPRWGTCYCRKPRKGSVFIAHLQKRFRACVPLTISLLAIIFKYSLGTRPSKNPKEGSGKWDKVEVYTEQ